MYHRRNVAIQETKLAIAKSRRPHFCRVPLAMILAMVLIAGALPAMSRAQAGGGGDDDQSSGSAADSSQSGNGQTSCGPGTGIQCPQGSNGAGNGTVGGQLPWQNGFSQGQRPNAGLIGPQPVGRANGPQRTTPTTKPAVPQPTELLANPDFLSACPAIPIQAEMTPIQEEDNPNTVINPNQRYPYNEGYPYTSAAEAANANAAAGTNQLNQNPGAEPTPRNSGEAPNPTVTQDANQVYRFFNPEGSLGGSQGAQGTQGTQGPQQRYIYSEAEANRIRTEAARERNLDFYSNPPDAPRLYGGIPYCDLPSVRDLNQMVPNGFGIPPKRFGSDAFFIGAGNADELPMDVPVGPDYVLGPGDSIMVNMWGGQSARIEQMIDRQGQISLPEAGAIAVTGLTIASAQRAIQSALNSQFQNEHVELSMGRVRTVRVYVVGDVQQPGAYDLSALSTPLNALYLAGGPTSRGSLRILRQYRGGDLVKEFDLYDFLLKGLRGDPGRLQPGDTILVPPAGPQVTVRGYVRRPAIYELHGETTLNQVLDLAGVAPGYSQPERDSRAARGGS